MEHDNELGDGDYRLVDGRAWFTVKKFAIWIRSTDEGVIVDIFKDAKEGGLGESITSTYAFDSEAEEENHA